MQSIKKEVRVIGIDDGPFDKFRDKSAIAIGTVFRGGEFLDGIISTKIKVDGSNSTTKIIDSINNCKFRSQLQCIFLDGINMAGFNVIDIDRLHKKTNIPVIVIMRKRPDLKKIFSTLKKLGMEKKIETMKKGGDIIKIQDLYVQLAGITKQRAKQFIKLTIKNAQIPEPLRIAHIIASGVIKGESYGNA